MAIEVKKVLVRDTAKLPLSVPEPPKDEATQKDPKNWKQWLENYHKSIVVPLQQQFKEIQEAIKGITNTNIDIADNLNSVTTSLETTPEEEEFSKVGSTLKTIKSVESAREYLDVVKSSETVKTNTDQTIGGNKTFLNLLALPNAYVFADDASAGAGGLLSGEIYKTATGELRIKL
jgi:hypothetical protein